MPKFFFGLVLFLLGTASLQAQNTDSRVKANLEKLNFEYNVKDDGTFQFTVPVGNRSQMIFVHSSTSQYDQLEIREVYSVIYQSNIRPSEAQLGKLLIDNSQKKLGAWEMIAESNNFFLVFTAKIPADAGDGNLKSTIEIVAGSSDAMEQLLFNTDEW